MIETTVLNYLKSSLGVPCFMENPPSPPVPRVVIEKTGSSKANLISSATFAIQSMASSLAGAAKLNDKVKKAMDSIPNNIDLVTESVLNTDYNFTDTSRKEYRYQAVYDLTYYEE